MVNERFGPEHWTIGRVSPRIEVREEADRLYVEMEIAGVRACDLHLCVEGRRLHIFGERWPVDTPGDEETEERELPYEVRFGQFHRSVLLPYEVEEHSLRQAIEGERLAVVLRRSNRASHHDR